jgi:hypothetical protein
MLITTKAHAAMTAGQLGQLDEETLTRFGALLDQKHNKKVCVMGHILPSFNLLQRMNCFAIQLFWAIYFALLRVQHYL